MRKVTLASLAGLLFMVASTAPAYATDLSSLIPKLKPMTPVQVPTFSQGLQAMSNDFATDQAQYEPQLPGNVQTFLAQNGGNESASQIFSGLQSILPDISGGQLPDVQSQFQAAQSQNQAIFSKALTSGSLSGAAGPGAQAVPGLSSLGAKDQSIVASQIAAGAGAAMSAPTLPSLNHQNLTVTAPTGWSDLFGQASQPYTKDSAMQNLQKPTGWGESPATSMVDNMVSGVINQFNGTAVKQQMQDMKTKEGLNQKSSSSASPPSSSSPTTDPFSNSGTNMFGRK